LLAIATLIGSNTMPSIEFEIQNNFCVLPWQHINLKGDGTVMLCCQGPRVKDEQGKAMTVYEHSIAEIWNSADMRAVRSTMVAGERVAGCRRCWVVEDRGGISRRLQSNGVFFRAGGEIAQLKADAKKADYFCHTLPHDYQMDMGNACNLKCRTCSSGSSSKIASDPVHRRWELFRGTNEHKSDNQIAAEPSSVAANASDAKNSTADGLRPTAPWFEDTEFLTGALFENVEEVTGVHVIGGEPLVIRHLPTIVRHIAKSGHPERVTLGLTTNGTMFDETLIEPMARFGRLSISVSIDGIGDYFDYIRYPGKWPKIVENLDRYASMPNVALSILPTVHIYNALHFADLLRFCDARGVPAIFNPLVTPTYLAASVLPPAVRRVAIERLRQYAASVDQSRRIFAESLAQELAEKGDGIDRELLRLFMLFTNDLDSTRMLKFKDVCAETVALMAQDGIEWIDETLHAESAAKNSPVE
jgi:MoaA/NifB/PqqE/SkfB family radical SAM enzyme